MEVISWLAIGLIVTGFFLMLFVMRLLFYKSVLYKIGISTGSVILLVSFITGIQSKLGPVHNIWAFPLQAAIAIAAYYYISVVIKRPLINIISIIKKISSGNLDTVIDDKILDKKDEVGDIADAMKQLQQGLREKAEFARKIGEGSLDDTFKKLSENDELGEALLNMQASLKNARDDEDKRKAEDAKRNWITEGQAKFAEILRQNDGDVSELSYNIISNMVKYMGINQGGLFIINDDDKNDKFLELTACYAFDRRKYLEKRIAIGEGLVGTCFLEAQSIYMKQIPQEYIRITSGLGDENPSALLIVPLKLNEEIFGVMELASFKPFEKHHIDFTERIGEIIASSISGLRITSRTSVLLEKSQQQAEEMRAQEEEMRQNMEELSATQEAMSEKDRENSQKIEELTQENEMLRQKLKHAEQELEKPKKK